MDFLCYEAFLAEESFMFEKEKKHKWSPFPGEL